MKSLQSITRSLLAKYLSQTIRESDTLSRWKFSKHRPFWRSSLILPLKQVLTLFIPEKDLSQSQEVIWRAARILKVTLIFEKPESETVFKVSVMLEGHISKDLILLQSEEGMANLQNKAKKMIYTNLSKASC